MLYNEHQPNGPDPGKYVLVVTKEGQYWRRKRGSSKKAVLNEAFQHHVGLVKITAPAAKRIVTKLRYYTERLETGRLTLKIAGLLRRQMKENGDASILCLKDLDLQPYYPIHQLLQSNYPVTVHNGLLEVAIDINYYTIKKHNGLVSDYFFELVLLYGDCMEENGLRTESESSGVYRIGQAAEKCRLQMVLPEKPWIALLKVSCIEENEMALHPKHYGMKVVAVGMVNEEWARVNGTGMAI
jgi:hypothetical protein